MVPDQTLRRLIAEKIQELVKIIKPSPAEDNPLSVMAGASGEVLYFFYMSKMQDSQELYDLGFDLLTGIFDAIEQRGIDCVNYCNGLAGFGVLLQLLVKDELIDLNVEDILLELDELLIEHTYLQLKAGNLDFLHGAIGDGFYLLSRPSNKSTVQCLKKLVEYLSTEAVRDIQGIRWIDQPSVYNSFTSDIVNFSLSHGLSSKLIFLAQCVKAQVETAECTTLLLGAVNYLQNQKAVRKGDEYPSLVMRDGEQQYVDRLAWCYGDLGVAVALLFAGKATGNTSWVEQAINLARRTAQRSISDGTGLVDAGFCHGTAGVAHLFGKLFAERKLADFQTARDYWLEQTLAKATFHDGLAGYRAYRGKEWHNDHYLLEGILGITLVLQSSLTSDSNDLSWDTLFLLNF